MSDGVIIAIIGFLGIVVGGYFAIKSLKATLKNNLDLAVIQMEQKQKETHDLVNSRMTELLELTKKTSRAEGKAEAEHDNADTNQGGSTLKTDVKNVEKQIVEVKKEVKEVKEDVADVKREIKSDQEDQADLEGDK